MTRQQTRVTIADVARQAGVSIATVSRVINRTAPVAEETEARVRAAIHSLNFVPHTAARSLASHRTNTLGLLLPSISGEFFVPMLRGIEHAAQEAGYDLLVYSTQGSGSRSRRPLGEHNTDGLLVFADSLDEADLVRFYEVGLPMVLLHQSPPNSLDIPCVTFENKSGARKLVDHLIEVHDCRRIVYLAGPPEHEDSYWRESGYRESLSEHGLPFDPDLVLMGGFSELEAMAATKQLLARGADFDAIFAGDDDSAIGAITALQEAGKQVPGDIAVAGFDDISVARRFTPPLTTVHAPIETAGYEAVQQLLQLINIGHATPLTLLPTELVIRQSCGCGQAERRQP